ncbi:hypothetical protein [Thiohalorhabdus methylotrophus]|uniref:Uncharacterized protein n=1 Tax=Thiohalorhabdus methylotrophus TaxID=3242694 RepID=A0ABV4TYS7_9GAMM
MKRFNDQNLKIAEIRMEKGSRAARQIAAQSRLSKGVMLSRAGEIFEKYKDSVPVSSLFILSRANLDFGNYSEAIYYATRASKLSENRMFRPEALRFKAQALFY